MQDHLHKNSDEVFVFYYRRILSVFALSSIALSGCASYYDGGVKLVCKNDIVDVATSKPKSFSVHIDVGMDERQKTSRNSYPFGYKDPYQIMLEYRISELELTKSFNIDKKIIERYYITERNGKPHCGDFDVFINNNPWQIKTGFPIWSHCIAREAGKHSQSIIRIVENVMKAPSDPSVSLHQMLVFDKSLSPVAVSEFRWVESRGTPRGWSIAGCYQQGIEQKLASRFEIIRGDALANQRVLDKFFDGTLLPLQIDVKDNVAAIELDVQETKRHTQSDVEKSLFQRKSIVYSAKNSLAAGLYYKTTLSILKQNPLINYKFSDDYYFYDDLIAIAAEENYTLMWRNFVKHRTEIITIDKSGTVLEKYHLPNFMPLGWIGIFDSLKDMGGYFSFEARIANVLDVWDKPVAPVKIDYRINKTKQRSYPASK